MLLVRVPETPRGDPVAVVTALGEPLDRAGPCIVTKAGGFGADRCLTDLQTYLAG